jgi:cysteine-rich repeat protein
MRGRSLFIATFLGIAHGALAVDAGPAPAEWTCNPDYYGTDDGCDCGCEVFDPDCTGPTIAVCDYVWCDDGTGPVSTDNTTCEPMTCGNGIIEGTEECDDGNEEIDDGCDDSCQLEPPVEWGPGVYCYPEAYSDGSYCHCGCGIPDPDCGGDASSLACHTPGGCIPEAALTWEEVTHVPGRDDNTTCVENVCGDAFTVGPEDCDDGNTVSGDGCSDTCTIEDGYGCEWLAEPPYLTSVCKSAL